MVCTLQTGRLGGQQWENSHQVVFTLRLLVALSQQCLLPYAVYCTGHMVLPAALVGLNGPQVIPEL